MAFARYVRGTGSGARDHNVCHMRRSRFQQAPQLPRQPALEA